MAALDDGDQGSRFQRNARGQTFGSTEHYAGPVEGGPDLILAVGDDGTTGYVRRDDLGYDSPGAMPTGRVVPLLASDGVTEICTKSLS